MIKGCQSPTTYETKNLSHLLHFTSDASQAHLSVEPYLAVPILASIHLFSTKQPAHSCKNKSDPITLSFQILQHLSMELEMKSPLLTLNVLSLPQLISYHLSSSHHSSSTGVHLVSGLHFHATFALSMTSSWTAQSHDHLMASPVTQVSALMPPPQRGLPRALQLQKPSLSHHLQILYTLHITVGDSWSPSVCPPASWVQWDSEPFSVSSAAASPVTRITQLRKQ